MADTKACSSCKRILDLDRFYIRKDTGRPGTECRECKCARGKRRYETHTAQHARAVKRRYDTHGRFARYGLTAEQYDAMLVEQGGVCALCRAEKPGGKGKWHIDHGHETGQSYHGFKATGGPVRGLLCHRCNQALGFYEGLLRRVGFDAVAAYLRRGGIDRAEAAALPSPR